MTMTERERGRTNRMGKGEIMEDMGMTDLQFKSWLRQIIRRLEEAESEDSKEKTDIKLDELLKDLREDLQG
ncbi:hypothetical protein B5E53_08820 [Eubacterium sp. An11]|nr:hypothetical protein B5E53_08820 [Eubacterium sp. An11]